MRVLDVGCGPGIYVQALRDMGIEADGVDIDPRCPFTQMDVFSQEFLDTYTPQQYDLCVSLEVAEHLGKAWADEFVRRLTQVAPTVLFSAAVPGQGGHGHINCQPKEYWIEKFGLCNYVLDETATNNLVEFMRQGYHMGWFVNNVMVFKTYGDVYYDQIIQEETPQAVRLAEYLKSFSAKGIAR
jgi:23S rRNA U2552 (ribose-2'-O)-methylase RlmE/FtsJ